LKQRSLEQRSGIQGELSTGTCVCRAEIASILDSAALHPGYELRAFPRNLSRHSRAGGNPAFLIFRILACARNSGLDIFKQIQNLR
jgi:hypothetical protein